MWLHIPQPVRLSAAESEANSSHSEPSCPSCELWCYVNGKPTRRELSWRGWKTRPWIKRLSGTTLRPSTAARGVESWMSSLRRSPAKATASQASAFWRMIRAIAGRPQGAYFGRFSLDGSSQKTSPACSFLTGTLLEVPGSFGFSESWPKTGGMRNGRCFHRGPAETVCITNGFSFWPRPDANTSSYSNGRFGPNLREAARLWKRPTTPRPHDTENTVGVDIPTQNQFDLTRQACLFSQQLQMIWKSGGKSSKSTRRLNQRFVEWLMAWPIGWTDSEQRVTGWTPYLARLRSVIYSLVCPGA